MTATQAKFPGRAVDVQVRPARQIGAWVSELLPHTAKVADELCFVKSMHTEAINHDPAITFFQTGFQLAGRPSIGAWLTYGLGSENQDLPGLRRDGLAGTADPATSRSTTASGAADSCPRSTRA